MSHGERRIWNQMEDLAIQSVVKEFGDKNWILISEKLAEKYGIIDRTGKQCRERWHNHINPELKKGAWTKEEERILFEQQKVYGNRWSGIGKHLPGRSDNSIKNQFYSALRRNLRKYNRNKPPNEKLKGPVKDLLLNPEIAKILVNYEEVHNDKIKANKKKSQSQKPKTSITAEASSILQSLSEDLKEKSEKNVSIPETSLSIPEKNVSMPETNFSIPETVSIPETEIKVKSPPAKIESFKSVELKIDSSYPVLSIYPSTPSTRCTPKFRKEHIFSFPDDALSVFNWDSYNNADLNGIHGSDSLDMIPDGMPPQKSNSFPGILPEPFSRLFQMQSPHGNSFIFPPFSPMDSFQHYLSPRNNK